MSGLFIELRWDLTAVFGLNMLVVVQSLGPVQLFGTPWTVARQVSLSFTIFQSLLKLMSIESVISPSHLVLCRSLLLLPSTFLCLQPFSAFNLSQKISMLDQVAYFPCLINNISKNSRGREQLPQILKVTNVHSSVQFSCSLVSNSLQPHGL